MKVLGLNIFHGDASACLIEDNKILIGVEEERLNRIKHASGFPINAIKFCLNYTNIDISQIDYVCLNRDPKANLSKKIFYVIKNKLNLKFLINRFHNSKNILNLKNFFNENFDANKINFKILNIEHHLSHISSSFHLSGFEDSAVMSVDGFGDFVSTMWGKATRENIDIINKIYFPHSLGIFYSAVTQHLGFPHYGDEYKLMGLSSYGENNYVKQIRKLFKNSSYNFKLNLDFFNHTSNDFNFDFTNSEPVIGKLFSKNVEEIIGKKREPDEEIKKIHLDIAKSTQTVYEEFFFDLCNNLYNENVSENLSLSGGCAQNSVANGKIYDRTKFRKVYISSASGDSGGALGSAIYFLSKKKIFMNKQMGSFYGPSYSMDYITKTVDDFKEDLKKKKIELIKFENSKDRNLFTARQIKDLKIVGWFQGCMEWGPRSLGNRAILANPAGLDIKDIINKKIKRRESFRPFAPSILEEHVEEWFEQNYESYFMSFVAKVKENKKNIIPSVVHVDGTGRFQTVTKQSNQSFYELINEFYKLSNIPILLNTSFNENEPIVMKPSEAIDCFLRTNMDLLVMENLALLRDQK